MWQQNFPMLRLLTIFIEHNIGYKAKVPGKGNTEHFLGIESASY